jgi:autotransporter-associated beta strand protein
VGAAIDPALANITISGGILGFQTGTSSMGDPTKTIAIGTASVLEFFGITNTMSKVCTINGGTIWGESGIGSQNTFAGSIAMSNAGGTFDAGSGLTGGAPNSAAVLNLTGNITGSGTLNKSGPGMVTLSGSSSYTGNTIVNAGTLVLNRSFTTGTALTINDSAAMKLSPSASSTNPLALRATSLSIPGSGSLDLANNAMIVDYTGASPLTSIRGLLQQGYFNASWIGPGLTSASAAAIAADSANPHKTALGYAEASGISVGAIPGASFDQTSVIVRYTFAGDANLDLGIDTTDFTVLAANFNQSGKHWFQGDFNYDGTVNALDFNLLASNYGATLASTPLGALVPEPSSLALLISILPRRSRRSTARRESPGCDCHAA